MVAAAIVAMSEFDRIEGVQRDVAVGGAGGDDGGRMQWAHLLKGFSSQYDTRSWAAVQVVGPPKVYPNHGDLPG